MPGGARSAIIREDDMSKTEHVILDGKSYTLDFLDVIGEWSVFRDQAGDDEPSELGKLVPDPSDPHGPLVVVPLDMQAPDHGDDLLRRIAAARGIALRPKRAKQ